MLSSTDGVAVGHQSVGESTSLCWPYCDHFSVWGSQCWGENAVSHVASLFNDGGGCCAETEGGGTCSTYC